MGNKYIGVVTAVEICLQYGDALKADGLNAEAAAVYRAPGQ